MFYERNIPHSEEVEAFGEHWCGPKKYIPWEDVLVARFEKDKGGDGRSVDVFGCATPARFYTLKVKSGTNIVGDPQHAFEVSTGSGAWKMAAEIASAIADGMLDFKPSDNC